MALVTRLRVVVTAEDIERGRPSAQRCPLARAIRRATPVRPIAVFGQGGYDAGGFGYSLPERAIVFVESFDRRQWGWATDDPPLTFYVESPAR